MSTARATLWPGYSLGRAPWSHLLTDEQEVNARGIIIDSAVLGIVCALAPALGIPAPEEARDRATRPQPPL
jgi:hypothetical protein